MSTQKAPIVAIVGRANVGKSSLFNALIGRREAIVAKEPGTTRDNVIAKVSFSTKDFWLVDTAGLKDPEDSFETTIQDQIAETAVAAEVIVVVVENDVPPTQEDRQAAKLALKTKRPVILVVNKADKKTSVEESQWQKLGIKTIVMVSAVHKTGLEELSEAAAELLPKTKIIELKDKIYVAILGRPNVGKSSLFNSIAKKQQALVAAKAGTTRDVNRLSIRYKAKEIEFMDTAGIRRSGKVEVGVEKFSVLRSIAAIEQSDLAILIIDLHEISVQLDQKIAGMVKEAGKGLILVVSKTDLLNELDLPKEVISASMAREFPFVPWAPLVFTSSLTGENITKLFELIEEIKASREIKIETSQLNKWLRRTTDTHPPAGLKGRQPKLNYMVQETDIDMPSFKIFGSHTKLLHWSYKRYLERKFREQWPLTGTPIKFWFIEKH